MPTESQIYTLVVRYGNSEPTSATRRHACPEDAIYWAELCLDLCTYNSTGIKFTSAQLIDPKTESVIKDLSDYKAK